MVPVVVPGCSCRCRASSLPSSSTTADHALWTLARWVSAARSGRLLDTTPGRKRPPPLVERAVAVASSAFGPAAAAWQHEPSQAGAARRRPAPAALPDPERQPRHTEQRQRREVLEEPQRPGLEDVSFSSLNSWTDLSAQGAAVSASVPPVQPTLDAPKARPALGSRPPPVGPAAPDSQVRAFPGSGSSSSGSTLAASLGRASHTAAAAATTYDSTLGTSSSNRSRESTETRRLWAVLPTSLQAPGQAPWPPQAAPAGAPAQGVLSASPAQPQGTKTSRRSTSPRHWPPIFSDVDQHVAAAYGHLPVTIRGRDPPAPLLSYNDVESRGWRMPPLLLRNAMGAFRLRQPTPVQSHVIPAVMEGRDVLAVSCTGSGKTLAYLLPALAQLMTRNRTSSAKNRAFPDALVLVPTRELAEQVFSDAQLLLRGSHVKPMVLHGGVSIAEQALAIRGKYRRRAGGADLVVATPGRLLQLVEQRRVVRLGRLGCLVVDEADTMLELGLWPDLRRLLSHPDLPTARQTVLVSASLPGELLKRLLRDQVTVVVGDPAGATGAVRQHVELLPEAVKERRLAELLAPGASSGVAAAGLQQHQHPHRPGLSPAPGPHQLPGPSSGTHNRSTATASSSPSGPAVVFTRTVARAEAVARQLAGRGVAVALLHRDLAQAQRDEALQCFRFGVASVLVATSLASRGLNFPDVAHVVNYDVPESSNDYILQVGRTGRGGRPGLATTFVTSSNRWAAPWLAHTLRRTGSPVPPWLEDMAVQAGAGAEASRRRAAPAAEVDTQATGTSSRVPAEAEGQDEEVSHGGERGGRVAVQADRRAGSQKAALGKQAEGHRKAWKGGRPAGPWRSGVPQRAVDLGDPTADALVSFGTFLPPAGGRVRKDTALAGATAADTLATPELAAGLVDSSAPHALRPMQNRPQARERPNGEPAVVDPDHDPDQWLAVFEAALRPLQKGPSPHPGAVDSAVADRAAVSTAYQQPPDGISPASLEGEVEEDRDSGHEERLQAAAHVGLPRYGNDGRAGVGRGGRGFGMKRR